MARINSQHHNANNSAQRRLLWLANNGIAHQRAPLTAYRAAARRLPFRDMLTVALSRISSSRNIVCRGVVCRDSVVVLKHNVKP